MRPPLFRIKQFFTALHPVVSEEERKLFENALNFKELSLFNQLPLDEQRHALDTVHGVLRKSYGFQNIDVRVLIKAALLHDIAKGSLKLTLFEKCLYAFLEDYLSLIYTMLTSLGKGPNTFEFFKRAYLHSIHPQLGAELLAEAGTELGAIELVRKHTDPPADSDSLELKILRTTDGMS